MSFLRKGQGGGAAALIAVIALVIIIYIALLPAGQREDLLRGNGSSEEQAQEFLLLEHPGRLEYLEEDKIEHSIPSMTLYSQKEAVIFKKLDSVYASKWLIGGKKAVLNFTIGDLEHTTDLVLGYGVEEGQGRLIINLNGNEILNKEVSTASPLTLSKEFLKEGTNTLTVTVSNPGLSLWKTNKYTIENLIVTGDFTDVKGLEASSVFIASTSEKNSLKRVTLKFLVECDDVNTDKLDISVNDHNIYSAIPDCGIARPVEFSPSFIKSGENKITLNAELGNFIVDQIKVTSQLKEFVYPIYYFNVGEDLYEDVSGGSKDMEIELKFFDNIALKSGKVLVNSHELYLSGKEQKFTREISDYITEGSNSIRIEPAVSIDVLDLTVRTD